MAGRCKPTLARDFESNRTVTVATTPALQQPYNSISALNSGLCDSHVAFVFISVCIVYQEIFVHALNKNHIYFHVQF